MTLPKIAEYFKVSYPAVRKWFMKLGIARRTNSEAQRLSSGVNLSDETLRTLYASGKSQNDIAKLYGLTQGAIKERMKRAGIKPRNKANPGSKNGMFGRTHTPEAIAKIKAANKRQFSSTNARERHALLTTKQIKEGRTGKAYNKLENKVAENLRSMGKVFEQQYRLGRYSYDFYIPQDNTLIEVHGTFWHADPRVYDHSTLTPIQIRNTQNDIKKSAYAIEHGYKLKVIWELDI